VKHLTKDWLFKQLKGLADAITTIHTRIPNLSIYHHDIKTRNILVMRNKEGKNTDYTFQITDWGCSNAQQHDPNQQHGSPLDNTKAMPPNNPPEGRNSTATSRPHDIWSLGCVFLEILIWYTKGWDELEHFHQERVRKGDREYWQRNKPDMHVGEVTYYIKFLEPVWPNLIRTIKLMLDPNPRTRITAQNIAHSF
tara:strand:- start:400 stop:984 length:585 start_codon:yes stop_codon:yes gene_type:complete